MCDEPPHELHSRSSGGRARTSLILFVIATAILIMLIVGPILLSSGGWYYIQRDHHLLAFLALLCLATVPILLAIGSVLALVEWRAARKASRRPGRMTVVAACLNLGLLLMGILLILVCLFWLVGPMTGLPRWPGW